MASFERYTPNEEKLMAILKELGGNPADSKRIVAIHYHGRRKPRFARQSVVSVLNGLIDKVKKNRESFRICKTDRCGPNTIKFWIEGNGIRLQTKASRQASRSFGADAR